MKSDIWRTLPEKFGKWHTIYMRFNRWSENRATRMTIPVKQQKIRDSTSLFIFKAFVDVNAEDNTLHIRCFYLKFSDVLLHFDKTSIIVKLSDVVPQCK